MKSWHICIVIAVGVLFLGVQSIKADQQVVQYNIGRVAEGAVITRSIESRKEVESVISGCECLRVEIKKDTPFGFLINLDTKGYRGKQSVHFFSVLVDQSIAEYILTFEVV